MICFINTISSLMCLVCLLCIRFDVSLLCVFLLFVCNPTKVCLWEKEDLTISLLCCLFLCCCAVLFLLGVCFLTVCVQSGECLFLGEGGIDYLFVVLCCSFLFLSHVCLCKKGVLIVFAVPCCFFYSFPCVYPCLLFGVCMKSISVYLLCCVCL